MASFDAANGTDTEEAVALDGLTIASPNAALGYPYQPTPEGVLTDAIAFLAISPAKYGFVDLGCGKGRTLITASKLGFNAVEGVEFATELVEIARRNLLGVGLQHCQVKLGDAAEYEFPARPLVIYIFNSFAEPVLERVLQNLQASGIDDFYLVYRNPAHPDVLHDSQLLTYLGSPPGRGGFGGIHVWTQSSPEAQQRAAPRPPRRAFRFFERQQLEPFSAVWGELGPTSCSSVLVCVRYRRSEPVVEHALACAFDVTSPLEPEQLRLARLAQSKVLGAFDYLREPTSEDGEVWIAVLKVQFNQPVTLARVGIARWSNAGPLEILDCKVNCTPPASTT